MKIVGGIWSHIIFRRILFEGADEETWRDLESYNFSTRHFLRELLQKVVGEIWSPINFRQILFEGADAESWRDLEPYYFALDTF